MKKWLLLYGAGSLAALVSSLALWAAGRYGLTQALDVNWAPGLSAHWLYPRIVLGGLWGFLFLLPLAGGKVFAKSALLALVPALVHLLLIFPFATSYGVGGLALGLLTPIIVYLVYFLWALITAITLRLA